MVVCDESERGSSGDEGIEYVMDTACVSMNSLEHGKWLSPREWRISFLELY